MTKSLVLLLTVAILSGCATTESQKLGRKVRAQGPGQSSSQVESMDLSGSGGARSQVDPNNPGLVIPGDLNADLDETEDDAGVDSKENVMRSIVTIPAEDNELVQKWIRFFTQRDAERFQRFLDRGEKYRELIEKVLVENELPSELYFLAMIESGFNTHANSSAKAKGVWQFMPATGKRYGLEVSALVDERRDPIRATEAAARYLKDLHNVFGSWHLAMAAYNAGETRIMNSVFRGRSRDFWQLSRKRAMPAETANYVPKFLAAMTIARDYKKYGFRAPQGESMPALEAVEVPSPVRLKSVADVTGLSLAMLEQANPHLLRGTTSTHQRSYDLWVPRASVALVQNKRSEIAQFLIRSQVPVAIADAGPIQSGPIHVVKRGENLTLIARKYSVSMAYLKKSNGLAAGKIHPGQRLRIAHHGSAGTQVSAAAAPKLATTLPPKIKPARQMASTTTTSPASLRQRPTSAASHKVRPGENLNMIARRFNTSVENLRKKNALRRDVLYVGQVLKIHR